MASREHRSVGVTAAPWQWQACSTHRWWWSRAEAKRAVRDHIEQWGQHCERCLRGGRMTWFLCKASRVRGHFHAGHDMSGVQRKGA